MNIQRDNKKERPVYAFTRKVFTDGMRDGFPIALGYFAVSFSLGIAARNAGLSPFQGFLASLFNNASAGEYAAFTLIAAGRHGIGAAQGPARGPRPRPRRGPDPGQRRHPRPQGRDG